MMYGCRLPRSSSVNGNSLVNRFCVNVCEQLYPVDRIAWFLQLHDVVGMDKGTRSKNLVKKFALHKLRLEEIAVDF